MMLFGKKSKKLAKQGSKSDLTDKSSTFSGPSKPVLGIPLPQAVKNNPSYDGIPVPAIVRQCIDYVEMEGLNMEGIYRISAPVTKLDELEKQANNGGKVQFTDPHEAAGLLKRFLRQLPEHVLRFPPFEPSSFEGIAETCCCPSDAALCMCDTAGKVKEMLRVAPKENLYLLAYVFVHAKRVIERQGENKMTLGALGVLLQAMLSVSKNVIKMFISNSVPDAGQSSLSTGTTADKPVYFFADIPLKRYTMPMTAAEITAKPPDGYEELSQEIVRQQNLLVEINEEVLLLRKQGSNTKKREDHMWDVQQGITLLKRKLKTLTKDVKEDDELQTTSTESESGTVCEPGPRLEKQLLTIQNQLIEEIAEEQRQISELTNRLQELQADLTIHEESLSAPSTPLRERTPLAARPKMAPPPPPKGPMYSLSDVEKSISTNGYLEDVDQNCDDCHRQEARQHVLVEQIAKMRNDCAQLRAQLEDSRENQNTMLIDAADDFGQATVLVTKF